VKRQTRQHNKNT